MKNKENNCAFMDGQNLNLGIQSLGWKLNFLRFRKHLYENKKLRFAISPYIQTCFSLLKKEAKENQYVS